MTNFKKDFHKFMYETFFGLKRRPFLAVPDTEIYFPTTQMEEARLLIERTIKRGEGIALVFGQTGVGKSLLLRILRKSLENDFNVITLTSGRLINPKALLQNLLYELHLPYTGADETELRLILDDYVRTRNAQGLLLLIDEAQFLDRTLLDEIRLLLNSDNGSASLFRGVLAGTNEFEEKLTLPQCDQFNQHVTTRIYLDTLSRTETTQYITWQTNFSKYNEKDIAKQKKNNHSKPILDDQFADNDRDMDSDKIDVLRVDFPHNKNSELIFTDLAKEEVFRLTDGSPRQINQLCDAALQFAAQQAVGSIDEILILAAWGKLQQINVDGMLSERANKEEVEKVKVENYDEIIARKKNTICLTEVSTHVEYGLLDDDSESSDSHEEPKQQIAYKVYKPPYPEDDLCELKNTDNETNDENINTIETDNKTKTVAQNTANFETENEYIDNNEKVADEEIEIDIDDESVEGLISFELSTATIESSQENIDNELLPELRSRSNRFGQPIQRQLFASKILQGVKKKGDRRFAVYFLSPTQVLPTSLKNCEENLRAVCAVYYCYKKSVVLRDNNNSSDKLTKKRCVCVKLNFTFWRKRILHSWIGNLSMGCIGIAANFFDVASCADQNENINENNLSTEIIDINTVNTDAKTIETGVNVVDIDLEESGMDRESLEKYGAAVLSGRPQFVRKEPIYVYQTGDNSPFAREMNICAVDKNCNDNVDANTELETSQQINVTEIQEPQNTQEQIEVDNNDAIKNTETKITQTNTQQLAQIDNDNNIVETIPIVANSNLVSNEIIDIGGDDVKLASDNSGVDISDGEVSIGNGEIVLNWVNEPFDADHGFGVAYREFATNSGNSEMEIITLSNSVAETFVGTCDSEQTSFDECFDEIIKVGRSTITLDEIYRSVHNLQNDPEISQGVLSNIDRRIVEAVKRIIHAVDKIEFVAEQAESAGKKINDAAEITKLAGQKIDQTAESVEKEVAAVIPDYKDMFKQLSDFQKTIAREVQDLKYQNINSDNYSQNDNYPNESENENDFSFNQSRPHDLKPYRNSGRRLSRPV
ncbi:MAG: AAA family ATPase, partial [Planctomycetaceae bacterium]|nr:AAA family ATPase [Planctomycetaceae bacterium]